MTVQDAGAFDTFRAHVPRIPAVLAVDGGASKTDAVLVGLDGRLLAHRRGAGSNPGLTGWEAAGGLLASLREELLNAVPECQVVATHIYLAGLDLPDEVGTACRELASWNADVVENDIFALLRTGTSGADAVAVGCGTGMNAVGTRADGRTARFLSLGELSGDWGGGAQLGRTAVWHAMRAEDRRGPATALVDRLPHALGLSSIEEVVVALHRRELGAETFSRLTPVLFATADDGDAIAQAVVDRQGAEIARMAASVIERLGLQGLPVPVVLGGGVVAPGNPRLIAAVTSTLGELAPQALQVVTTAAPILGAALAALETARSESPALDRLATAARDPGWLAAGDSADP